MNKECNKIVEQKTDCLYKNQDIPARLRAEDILNRMTLKEKIGQLNQRLYGFSIYECYENEVKLSDEFKDEVEKYSGLGVLYGLYRADPWSGRDYTNGLIGELAPRTYNMIQKYVIEHSRLGIPMMLSTECPHGHQALDGYLLPVNLGIGATFHPKLYKKACAVCGKQLEKMGVDLALVSMLDILRDPRWGRSEECYGEDPFLASKLAIAAVSGIQEQGVAVVAKHFCAQGEGTGGINASAARIGERELREIHLPTAKAIALAGVQGIMAAYNEIDGIPCHANKKLLTHILREEIGFKGVVMSDGVAIDQLDVMTGDRVLSGAKALKSGVDIGLWDTGFGKLDEAYERGLITMEDIDKSVLRVLTMKFERGLFDNPYIKESDSWSEYNYSRYPEALNLARESIVMLKNDGSLPIDIRKTKSIAIIGPNADEIYHQLGDYTPPINEKEGITVLQGIKNYITSSKESVEVRYAKGCGLFHGTDEMIKEAVELAKTSDITILVLGGSSSRFQGVDFASNGAAITNGTIQMDCGEGVDCADLNLPGLQTKLAEEIFKVGCNVVTVIIQGRPYIITDIVDKSKGVLCGFYPGIKGGSAIAEILFGTISPSGRLPVSIPRHSGQLPVYYNHKASYKSMNYYDVDKTPLYSFGFGLSYTEFQYSKIEVSYDKDMASDKDMVSDNENIIQVSFHIANNGAYDSYAVPQLYIRHMQGSTIPRSRELKNFDKVWISKGETVSCFLKLDREKLSTWDEELKFVVESGEVEMYLCDCGKDIWTGRINKDVLQVRE